MHGERLTVPALVRRRAREQPEKSFVVTDDDTLTYEQLDRESAVVACELAEGGIGKGTRVGVLLPNGTSFPIVAFGVSRAGGTVVPLSTLLRPRELEAHLRAAGVEHLVVATGFANRDYLADLAAIAPALVPGTSLFVEVLPRLRSIRVWDGRPARADTAVPDAELVAARDDAVRPADDLCVIFTSGSAGPPKAVIHTHGGALGATASGLDARTLRRDDRLYIPMPFFWVGGFGTGLLSTLISGATLLTEALPTPDRTLPFLEREAVTLFRGWPAQAEALARHPRFASTDLTSLGAGSLDAVLPPSARRAPGSRPNLLGMTETFGPYCGDRLDRPLPPGKEGSCGRPFAGIDVRVVDHDRGLPVDTGAAGEIQVRSSTLMRGICGRTRAETFTEDGYYPTGDLGRIDEDGYLYLTGRRDDMFKVRGATVYPSEVEAALNTVPDVEQAFVVDLDAQGSKAAGAVVVGAVVVLADGARCDRADLEREARNRLSAFKVPTRWAIVTADEVPMTPTGKPDKAVLRRLLG